MDKLLFDNPTQAWLVSFFEEGKKCQRVEFAPSAQPAMRIFRRKEPDIHNFSLEAIELFEILPTRPL